MTTTINNGLLVSVAAPRVSCSSRSRSRSSNVSFLYSGGNAATSTIRFSINKKRLTATKPRCIVEPANYIVSPEHFISQDEDFESEESMLDLYERWMRSYGVFRDDEEKKRRFKTFAESAKFVHDYNKEMVKEGRSCRLGFNDFSDWTKDEFKQKLCSGLKLESEEELAALPSRLFKDPSY